MSTVTPDSILRELTKLWVSLGKQDRDPNGAGVLRACSMTLVVLADIRDDAQALGETVASLMPEHPARAIVVRFESGGDASVSARVYSQCWMPFKQRQQICCEQIEITMGDRSLADLPPLILPLVAPDLPVIVWTRCARLVQKPEFRDIARLATKIIIDSAQLEDAKDAVAHLAGLPGGVLIGDLAWTRLTRWREMLAQVFENRNYLAMLPGISGVRVAYPKGSETSGRYMGAWLANGLRDAGIRPQVELALAEDFAVRLAAPEFQVEVSRNGGALTIALNGLSQCTCLPQATDYLTMREELGILRRDPVFEAALKTAAEL